MVNMTAPGLRPHTVSGSTPQLSASYCPRRQHGADNCEGAVMSLPMVVPDMGLPSAVTIYEVGPRDGLQNESAIVPLDVKVHFVHRLVDAGLPIVEANSFDQPNWVPQLAVAAQMVG